MPNFLKTVKQFYTVAEPLHTLTHAEWGIQFLSIPTVSDFCYSGSWVDHGISLWFQEVLP